MIEQNKNSMRTLAAACALFTSTSFSAEIPTSTAHTNSGDSSSKSFLNEHRVGLSAGAVALASLGFLYRKIRRGDFNSFKNAPF